MILKCLICRSDFDHPASNGRPPSFCSEECKAIAKRNPLRKCRTCGTEHKKQDMPYPAYCSEDCRPSGIFLTCRECNTPIDEGLFCSVEHMTLHQPPKQCVRCGQVTTAPIRGPWSRMPRYCSQACRQSIARGPENTAPATIVEARKYCQTLEYMLQPYWHLPVKGTYRPYTLPRDLISELDATNSTAKLLNSIAWWNHCIPRIHRFAEEEHMPTELLLADIGRAGWGGAALPTGCLPMYEVFPYLSIEAFMSFKMQAVLNYWSVASRARRFSDKQIEQRKQRVNNLISDFDSGAKGPMFKPSEVGSSPFIRTLTDYLAMHEPPSLANMHTPIQISILFNERWLDCRSSLERIRLKNTGKWQVASWANDPPPPKDRTMDRIEQILDNERRRLNRRG